MKRLLCIVGSMDVGGAETFLMKIYRNIDKTKFQFDFCVAKKEKNFYEDEIISMGGKIYRITPKTESFFKNFKDIKKIVKDNKYENVLRVSQHSLSAIELLAAKMGGAKKLAFRSSNSNNCGSKINLIVHYIFRPFANMISNIKIAPSKEAAQFMFGNKNVKKGKVVFIHNAIDFEKYKFNIENRKRIRKELIIKDNEVLIGHVGRFNYQKNHKFLLDIFKRLLDDNKKYKLLLIGNGELKKEVMDYAKQLKVLENTIFMDVISNVNEYYSAMDIYLFPSLFEGMPNTVIEAQAAGLNCILSNTITKEANITGNIEYLNLNDEIEIWKKSIDTAKKEQKDIQQCFKQKNYLISEVSNELIRLF